MQERDLLDNKVSTTVRFKDVESFVQRSAEKGVVAGLKTLSCLSLTLGAEAYWKVFCTPRAKLRKLRGIFHQVKTPEDFFVQGLHAKIYRFPPKKIKGAPTKKALLVHGWEGQAIDLESFIEPLVLTGFEVLAIDGPAHGLARGKQTHAFEFAKIISELNLQEEGLDLIIGHSFGGFATALALYLYPELGHTAFVSLASPHEMEGIFNHYAKRADITPEALGRLHSKFEAEFKVSVKDISFGRFLRTSSNPALIVHDKFDRMVSYEGAAHACEIALERHAHMELFTTEGLGHRRILKDPRVIKKVLSFYKALTP